MKDRLHLIDLLGRTCIFFDMISLSLPLLSTPSPSEITGESLESLTSIVLSRYFENDCLLAFLSPSDRDFPFGPDGPYSIVNVKELDGADEDRYIEEVLAPSMEIGCHGHVIQTEDPQRQLSLIERTYMKVRITLYTALHVRKMITKVATDLSR